MVKFLRPPLLWSLLTLLLSACASQQPQQEKPPVTAQPAQPPRQTFLLGVDVLRLQNFSLLEGKRIGLLSHPAGVDSRGIPTMQLLHRAPNVNLVALYGPEHGLYGKAAAGDYVEHKTDPLTRLPIYSLYGKTRKPTPAMLRGLDVFVIDLQDIGTRSYTYISAMGKAMEACFEQGVPVVVLDRPNPLGGLKVGGAPLDEQWESYVGDFPGMPYVHGLTIGEVARMAKATPGWLEIDETTRRKGKLSIIPMRGWERTMTWPDTRLKWVATSPYIQDLSSVLGYPMTGLGGIIGGWSHGIGTPYPFRFLRNKNRTPAQVAEALRARKLGGLEFRVLSTQLPNGRTVEGVFVVIKDWSDWNPSELNYHMMQLEAQWAQQDGRPNPFAAAASDSAKMRSFLIHTGSQAWWDELQGRGASARLDAYLKQWRSQSQRWQQQSKRFWIY